MAPRPLSTTSLARPDHLNPSPAKATYNDRMQRRDARAILGLPPGHSDADVEAAFRRGARQHHPDRGGNPNAFRLLVEARRVLLSAPSPRNVVITDDRNRLIRLFDTLRHRKRRTGRRLR